MATEVDQKNSIETNPKYKEFKSLLDEDFKERKLRENEIIKATVTEITKNFVVVDCKAKMEGMIPIEEFKNDSEFEKLKVNSKVDVYLERIESFKGEIGVSREKAKRMVAWKKMEKVFETQEEVTGIIVGRVKGGYQCNVDNLPTFMPSSQIAERPLKKVDHLFNVPIKVIATRIDKKRGNVCTSRRAVLEKSKNAELKEALKNLKEGDIVENAKVKATTEWGIFLDINGIDALLHVSDLSYGRVKKPSDLVTIGQNLKVKITKIDKQTSRVSASIKALTLDPYENLSKKYRIGEIYEGTCTSLKDYGVFVKLEEGVEGLIHNSELSWQNRNVQPSKVLSPSQNVRVKIINIDKDAKRISLSYRETLDNPWNKINDSVGKKVKIKIKNITDKAIFGELESGLVGMLHYKELDFNEKIENLSRYKKNDMIDVRVIEVKDEKIRFSKRSLDKDPMDWFKDNKKKVGDVIPTRVHEVMKTGVKVSIDNDKKLIVSIKKGDLAKTSADARPEIFSPGNALDAKLVELDIEKRKIKLSVKAAQIDEEKSLVAKFGAGATKSGATLKGIFEKALGRKSNKKKR